jgi:hypothetical protein
MSLARIFQAHVVSDLPPPGGGVGDVEGRGNSASRCSRVRGAGSEPDYTAPSLGSTADD